jgi:sugar/nucleoside kinase (ribokinase family)
VRALLWPQFARSLWAQPATVVVGTTGEGDALASVCLSAWAQPATVVTGTAGGGTSLVSVRSVGMCSVSHYVGVHDS